MSRFKVPQWVYKHTQQEINSQELEALRERLKNFDARQMFSTPLVSIVIPAYNEEKSILQTLSSLSYITTKHATEILVVNNNSKDKTQEILDTCGIRSIFERTQGISIARQTGLEQAKGKYILNADADSIYPSNWVDTYVQQLENLEVTCVYGRYSFIPSKGVSRMWLGIYEIIAENLFSLRRKNRDYLNVMGFNFAFRKEDALRIGGFNTSRARWSDGWMAMTLMNLGRIELVKTAGARVWTSDRRLMHDGGLGKAFYNRVKKEITRLTEYVLPSKLANQGLKRAQ